MYSNPPKIDRIARKAGAATKWLSGTIALTALLLAQVSSEAQNVQVGPPMFTDPLVGTWNVLTNAWICGTEIELFSGSKAMALFNGDGTRHETNATSPALRSPGYGNWYRVEQNEYDFAFKFYRFDATGAHIGSTSVRHELFLSADGTSYYSVGIVEILGTDDSVQLVICSDATATRFE